MFVRQVARYPWLISLRSRVTLPLALLCTLSLLLGAMFVELGAEVREPDTTAVDGAILGVVTAHTVSWPTTVAEGFSFPGSELFIAGVALCLALGLVWQQRRLDALFVAVAITGSAALTLTVKYLVGRPRPVAFFRVPEHGYSFPSGHTLSATCLALVVAYLLWRSALRRGVKLSAVVALAVVVILVGLSRLVLGVHYLTDVVGSMMLGTAWVTGLIVVRSAFSRWRTPQEN